MTVGASRQHVGKSSTSVRRRCKKPAQNSGNARTECATVRVASEPCATNPLSSSRLRFPRRGMKEAASIVAFLLSKKNVRLGKEIEHGLRMLPANVSYYLFLWRFHVNRAARCMAAEPTMNSL